MILPPVQRLLNELHSRYSTLPGGDVATYIPELSRADPDWFGIAVVTLDGHTYTAGDCDVPFTIQSISKPFVYGLALEDNGEEEVLSRVGLEPTGDAFNAISLDAASGRPSNPMINAGAIATAAMVKPGERGALSRVLEMFSRYVGHEVVIDESVYQSESTTGHRNRAIGHMLRNFDIVVDDPEQVLDLYFRQCSIVVTCRDLALLAACLANGGVNPVTGDRVIDARYVGNVLSIMGTCGMYNYAGEWIYRVGMPAKSGVSGGVLASLVGQLGIGVFSPPLDARGNSVRGVLVCDSLSRKYSLNMLNVPNVSRSTIRASYDGAAVQSKRRRWPEAAIELDHDGNQIAVYELQGELNFASIERFSREASERADTAQLYVIDFKRAGRIDNGAVELMNSLLQDLLAAGKRVALAEAEHLPGLAESVVAMAQANNALHLAENRDRGLEWCENTLLEREGVAASARSVPLEGNELYHGLELEAIEELSGLAVPGRAAKGQRIISAGQQLDSVYLLVRGEVSVTVDLPHEEHVRLATHSAGMMFGHMALAGVPVHMADVTADTDVEYYTINTASIQALSVSDPRLGAAVFQNIARELASELLLEASEIRALSS